MAEDDAAPCVAVEFAPQAVHHLVHVVAQRERRLAVPLDRVADGLCEPERSHICCGFEQAAAQAMTRMQAARKLSLLHGWVGDTPRMDPQ